MQILQTICCVIKCTIKFVWLTCRQNWNTLLSRRRKQLLDLSNDTRKLMHVCSLDVKDSNVYFCYFLVIVFYVLHCMLQYIWCASCHSCNFILSPYYCFVHVDLVVTLFFFFWISDLVVTYVAFVFIFIYKLSFVSIPSSINPFLCHIYQTLCQLVSLERQKEFLGLLNPQPPPWTSSAASWHHFWRSHWM